MDTVNLTIQLSPSYKERVSKAKENEDLHKCRSWLDLMNPIDQKAEVELNDYCIIVRCKTSKGSVQDSCTYDGVLAVTEMQDGILLRLSHKRLLWLPVLDDAQDNERLMDAMLLLCTYCKYHFKGARLRLKRVGIAKRLLFYLKTSRGYYTGDFYAEIAAGLFLCMVFFVGTVFVSQVLQNQKIQRHEAIILNAEFQEADPAYGKTTSRIKYIDLLFENAEEQTVDGCCLGHGLQEKLERIPSGTQMQLLLHPDSGNVLQIQVSDEVLLDFNLAQERLWNEALSFVGLGVFMYAVGIALLVRMFWKKRK